MTRRRPPRPTGEAAAWVAIAAAGAGLYALGVIPIGLALLGGGGLLLAIGSLYGHDRLAAYTDGLEKSAHRLVDELDEARQRSAS